MHHAILMTSAQRRPRTHCGFDRCSWLAQAALLGLIAQSMSSSAFAAGAAQPAAMPPVKAAEPPSEAPLPDLEGAIGAVLSYGQEITGSARYGASLSPVGYVRYKRLTISRGAGGFVNRRADDLVSGLGLDLVDEDETRISLSLRLDRGRREDASALLRGMGDVPGTVRLRVAGAWRYEGGWRSHLSWTVDAFNRDGGNLAELGLGYEHALAPRTVVDLSARLALAGPRYQQTYFGVSAQQAQASGYPVYEPGLGLRDLNLSAGLRTDLGPHWGALAGLGFQRLLGPSARSPLVQRVNGWSASAGLVWRF